MFNDFKSSYVSLSDILVIDHTVTSNRTNRQLKATLSCANILYFDIHYLSEQIKNIHGILSMQLSSEYT